MQEPRFRTVETNGVRLRCVVEGSGPLCVLVHGFPESWYSWRHQIPALVAAGYRVCVPDVRGYGGSDKPHAIEAYDLTSLSDDIAGLIAALGEQSAVLIGHDWGAPIVWTTAIRHASRVRAVIGMSVPHLGRGDRPTIDVFRHLFQGRFFYQLYFQEPGVAEAELQADPERTIRLLYFAASGDATGEQRGFVQNKGPDANMLDGLSDPDPLPAWMSREDIAYVASQFKDGFRGPLNRYRNFERDWELLPELSTAKVSQPALFIAGDRDPVLSFVPGLKLSDVMEPWYADLRGKILIEGAGHWIQQERPEAVNRALVDFLEPL